MTARRSADAVEPTSACWRTWRLSPGADGEGRHEGRPAVDGLARSWSAAAPARMRPIEGGWNAFLTSSASVDIVRSAGQHLHQRGGRKIAWFGWPKDDQAP